MKPIKQSEIANFEKITKAAKRSGEDRLTALAHEINREHDCFETCLRKTLQHAYQCGALLNQSKKEVGHGNWEDWVSKNVRLGIRQAQNYMKWFKKRDALVKAKGAAFLENLSLDDALKAISELAKSAREAEKDYPVAAMAELRKLERKKNDHANAAKITPDEDSGVTTDCGATKKQGADKSSAAKARFPEVNRGAVQRAEMTEEVARALIANIVELYGAEFVLSAIHQEQSSMN